MDMSVCVYVSVCLGEGWRGPRQCQETAMCINITHWPSGMVEKCKLFGLRHNFKDDME